MQNQMAAMMNSPMMQSMMENPELLRSLFQSNPQIQQVDFFPDSYILLVIFVEIRFFMDPSGTDMQIAVPQMMNSNPEIASLLNNPEVLRDSLRMASNPVSYPRPSYPLPAL